MFPEFAGLSHAQVKSLQTEYGPNTLPRKDPPTRLIIFLSQLKNPFVYVLIGATIITLIIGHKSDALIISIAILINTILGYVQEYRANNTLKTLTNYLTSHVKVKRQNQLHEVETSHLVPGDIVILDAGNRIPADGTILFANRSSLNEALLTGESFPIPKKVDDQVYMGTILDSGQLVVRVDSIGANTKMGAIANRLKDVSEDSPLRRQLSTLSQQIMTVIFVLLIVVILLGISNSLPLSEIFVTAVALAVSSIPEGLVVSLTIILAIGMQKIMKYKGLVRHLSSAETLGGVTTICLDKTGTLTTGEIQVSDYYGNKIDLADQVTIANDRDDSMVEQAYHWGKKILGKKISHFARLDSLPFSAKRRYFASLHRVGRSHKLYVSGAPEIILRASNLKHAQQIELTNLLSEWTTQGKRVIAYAAKTLSPKELKIKESHVLSDLNLTGIIAYSDPVRLSVARAFQEASKAGINLIVITGDYAATAKHVLSLLDRDLDNSEIMLGQEFENLSTSDRIHAIQKIKLFARANPDQKYLIIKTLKESNEVVAMLGDGVNDAPALHLADIGVVVGSATDVAKETADLILLDSNFATVIQAIKQGRVMFANIRKIILYLLCDAFAEIFVVIVSMILKLPLPLTAAQILWINIVSDGFPSLALTVDPPTSRIMSEPPRSPSEKLVTRWMVSLIILVSTIAAVFAFGSYYFVYQFSGDYLLARSVSFLTLGINSLAYVFSVRILTTPFWKEQVFENKYLVKAVLLGLMMQALPFVVPPLRSFFATVALAPIYWIIAITLSISLFFVIELFKYLLTHHFIYHTTRS